MTNTDTPIFIGIFVFFLFLGAALPFINAAFNEPTITNDINSAVPTIVPNAINFLTIAASMSTIFFWSFGQVPFIADLAILTPLRVLGAYLLIRMFRGI